MPCTIIGLLTMLSLLKIDFTTHCSLEAPCLLVLPTLIYYALLDLHLAMITAVALLPITALIITLLHFAPILHLKYA